MKVRYVLTSVSGARFASGLRISFASQDYLRLGYTEDDDVYAVLTGNFREGIKIELSNSGRPSEDLGNVLKCSKFTSSLGGFLTASMIIFGREDAKPIANRMAQELPVDVVWSGNTVTIKNFPSWVVDDPSGEPLLTERQRANKEKRASGI